MTFLFPLGLLGLIGIPIVVLIYILRNKFNEQTVPSTYLWELSEKFYKRRNPLSGITGLISLILQILTIAVISFAIARPIFVLPKSAGEYCFILDASGSMNIKTDGESRFALAKEAIEREIKDSRLGSTYTLIHVSTETTTAYERLTDKALAIELLEDLECSDASVSYTSALSTAQKYFNDNPSFSVSLFTDKDYTAHTNVNVVKFGAESDVNYAIGDVEGVLTNNTLTATANVVSYTKDATLNVALYLNEDTQPISTAEIAVKKGEPTPISLKAATKNYRCFRLAITNEDALSSDNEIISYNQQSEAAYSILIVSETPFFLEAALDVFSDSEVEVVAPNKYTGQSGYGLYIFHSYTPEILPDAAVWLINSNKSVPDSGFGIRGTIELDEPSALVKSDSTATTTRALLNGIDGRNIYISEYVKYSGMYTKFTTLFSYNAHPLIMAGVNALGNREVVFGFDLHKTDLPLSSDFAPLICNLLAYTCPDVLDRTDFVCGEDANVNITANMKNVKGISPDGEEIYIDNTTDIGVLHLDKVGTYTVRFFVAGEEKNYQIYASAPEEESNPVSSGESFSLTGEQQYEKTDGTYDPLMILFICLALLFIADWMVYCYEKYQLR